MRVTQAVCLYLDRTRTRNMMLLLALLCALCAEPARSLEEDEGFILDGDLRQFAVGNNNVYIVTETRLYQLRHDLKLIHSLDQRGSFKDAGRFNRVSESTAWTTTFRVNVLLPFVENKTLVSCGVTDNICGYCEVLDLKNISNLLYSEQFLVGPKNRSDASVSFLVDVKKDLTQTHNYILTAVQQQREVSSKATNCASDSETINLHNVDNTQNGGIFSLSGGGGSKNTIKIEGDVEFVDGFQINSTVFLFSNVLRPSDEKAKVRLIWLESKTVKTLTPKSPRETILRVSDRDGSCRLLASSIIPGGQQVLWSGVFGVEGEQSNTQLVVFDISPDHSIKTDAGSDVFKLETTLTPKILKPVAVLLKKNHMTSVLAVRQRSWMVFFIGTGDGQLIKLVVDRNYRPACPRVLYRAITDHQVFPNIHLDPVDQKHVYVPFRDQVKRVPVSKCSSYRNVQDCWSAQDPFCVWCASNNSCTFESDCKDSYWLSIPDGLQQKMVSHKVETDPTGQIKLIVQTHLNGGQDALSNFACQFSAVSRTLNQMSSPPKFPQCTNILSNQLLSAGGVDVTVKIRLGKTVLTLQLNVINCSDIYGEPGSVMCQKCIKAGCGWRNNVCSWANEGDSFCPKMEAEKNFSRPEISSIQPSAVSFYGRNHAVLSGRNLRNVTGVRIQADMDCSPRESPVWNNTGGTLTFHIPSTDTKGVVKVCLLLPDGSCHGDAKITYKSAPICTSVTPSSTWMSGKRTITLVGSHLDFVEDVIHSHNPKAAIPRNSSYQNLIYETPAAESTRSFSSIVHVKVANQTRNCAGITYYPDPVFTSFTSVKVGDDVHVTVEKEKDNMNITAADLSIWGVYEEKLYPCVNIDRKPSNNTESFICKIKNERDKEFQQLQIKYGDKTITLKSSSLLLLWILLVILSIPIIIIVVMIVYRTKQKKLNDELNQKIEKMELDIRNDIRQGFVDLQTDRDELLENVGTIPFLDYKHFASKIFFPESETLMTLCVKDIGQDGEMVQLDECCQGFSRLIQDQLFLTSMVHALEEQKSFTIKDKCALASLLTVALHSNLTYLTEVMKVLLKDLMERHSNTQPKLLLRRTESTVEKLLTNWMSICLYGFLRETVGQHMFLMVSALTQHIAKGPVDSVTEKALYTLSEDWLLWQAQDFSSLKLKVLFGVGSDSEVSEPLEVDALSCDTVEQLKEKILTAFKAKFGFPYNITLRDICVEYEKDGSFIPLQEVHASSEVIGEVTMLNTLEHYKVTDGATIKVLSKKTHRPLSPQGSLKDEENFCRKYFHLIDPDVDEDQGKSPERKKLKVKEVHLTKLVSTKVAVHSFVENLFRSIWGMSQGKAPLAVKFFFDFLDAQADNMKISDPDIRHIWKTNSLPLRFWVNILKNPQFVFDMEKTPHLDGCLSVIAQAFMDSFSLSEMQLGKHAPTNKLLYAKDIPKFKQEVKMYYKYIGELKPITELEFKEFLQGESKKHENEFNEAAALKEIYKFTQRYFTEIKEKLDQNGAPAELKEQLQHVKESFERLKSCSWN